MARPWTGSPRLPSDHRYAMGWRISVVTRWGGDGMARPWTGSPGLPSDHRYAMGWRISVVMRWGGRWDGSSVDWKSTATV